MGDESVLAEQLLTFAQDFIAEYQQYNIIGMMRTTAGILQRKAGLDLARYGQEAAPLRQNCNKIIAETRFNAYPTEWQRVISESGLARFLPAKAAKEVLTALPTNRDMSPQSTEMNIYETQCADALAVAQSFIPFVQRFSVERMAIPKDELGILIELPRHIFENEADGFLKKLERFTDLIATLSEIVSGHRHSPKMLYVSTSDPSIMLSTILDVAPSFIGLYKDILEAIIKSLEIAKAFGMIREIGSSVPTVPNVAETMIRTSIDRLIDVHGKVDDEGRKKELHNELLLRAKEAMPTIRAGARLSVAVTTNENTITRIVGDSGTVETLTQQSQITQTLEIKLENLAAEPALQIKHDDELPQA